MVVILRRILEKEEVFISRQANDVTCVELQQQEKGKNKTPCVNLHPIWHMWQYVLLYLKRNKRNVNLKHNF